MRSKRGHIRHHIEMLSAPRSFFWQHRGSPMTLSPPGWTRHDRLSASGENVFSSDGSKVCESFRGKGVQPNFPPQVMVEVKALACELPYIHGIPLSRFSINDIHREVLTRGIVAQISGSTLWRWLHSDAIRPWYYRSWIFPRDPAFAEKAGPVHASWLNQIEIFFSIVQRKVLTPNHFESLADLEDRLMKFQDYYEKLAEQFKWKFTRQNLTKLMKKIDQHPTTQKIAA